MIRYVEQSLTLYVEQLAWLHSTPKDAKRPRIETVDPAYPPIGYGKHLVQLLSKFREMTYAEIESRDSIAAKHDPEHKPLTLWESETLVNLRRSYENMYSESTNTHRAAPYISVEHELAVAAKNSAAMWAKMWAFAKDGSSKTT